MSNKKTRFIIYSAITAALVVILTFIRIPLGEGAMVHLGSVAIVACALLFGAPVAGLGAAVGSTVFDLISGMSPYTVWSFFIKGAMGLTIGYIAFIRNHGGKSVALNIFASVCGGLVSLAGYIIAWAVVLGSIQAAIANIPFSLLTSAIGIIVGVPLAKIVSRSFKFH